MALALNPKLTDDFTCDNVKGDPIGFTVVDFVKDGVYVSTHKTALRMTIPYNDWDSYFKQNRLRRCEAKTI